MDKLRKYKSLYSSTTNTFSTGESVTITPASVTGLPTDTEITLTFDRVDGTGTKTPDKMERIRGTISGSNFVVSSGGRAVEGTEQVHTAPVVEMVWNADDLNDMVDWGLVEHGQDGKHTDALVTSLKASGATINTGTDDATIVTPKALADSTIGTGLSATTNTLGVYNNSMARQAIINGNFDVWQRGTSFSIVNNTILFSADRWKSYANNDGGTLPTLTRTREVEIDDDGSYYFTRLTSNGAGSSLGVNSQCNFSQSIEFGTRYLCGSGKKVTISFYARSSIAGKRICPNLHQKYGTGGSPTSVEVIMGTPITLTSSWVKYQVTFITNTLVGKTFGTNNDDMIDLNFWHMWGTTLGNTYISPSVTAETFGGSGTVDIKKVQLCAGDVALPFMPKSYEEELRACMRYYEKIGGEGGDVYPSFMSGLNISTTISIGIVPFKVDKRIHTYALETTGIAANYMVYTPTVIACSDIPKFSSNDGNTKSYAYVRFTVASGLTVSGVGQGRGNNTNTAYLAFNAEL